MKHLVATVCLLALGLASAVPALAGEDARTLRDAIDTALAQDPAAPRLQRSAPGLALQGGLLDVGGLVVALRAPPPPPPPPAPPGELTGPVYATPAAPVVVQPAPQAAPAAAPAPAPAAAPAEPLPKTCGWFGPCQMRPDPWTCKSPCAPPEPCDSPWSTQLTLGFNLAQGNTDKIDLGFGGEVKYEQYPWILRWVWLYAYGETDGTATTDAFNSDVRAERRFGTKWSVFTSLDFNSDSIADLQYRWIANAGAGYWVWEHVGTYLKLEAGAGWTWEKRRFLTETSSPSGYAGAEFLYEFRNNIDYKARARYFPNFDEHDLSLFVLEMSLAVPLCEWLSLSVALRMDHVIQPPAPKESTDLLLTLGLQANF